jgi:hypothetical protein
MAIGKTVLSSAGGDDAFVAELASDDTPIAAKRFGDASNQTAAGIAVDRSGKVLLAGYFGGATDFGTGTLTSGGNDGFVLKLDDHLAAIWAVQLGGAGEQVALGLAVDRFDNVLTTGYFTADLYVGPTLIATGDFDAHAIKLDPSGNQVWARVFGPSSVQAGTVIAADFQAHPLVGGFAFPSIDFGAGVVVSTNNYDGYIAKLAQ